jgi:S1-C subfamily serine protease
MRAILDKNAPAIVTVRMVLKTEMQFMGEAQDQESRAEAQGVVVDPSGLILLSNSTLSASHLMEMLGGMGADEGQMQVNVTPLDIKVVIGSAADEHTAFLVARDSKLDLAFIQIETLGELELTSVAFGEASPPAIGDWVVSVSRLGKGFDYAPFFEAARVAGEIMKPRKALILDGRAGGLGLPVFSLEGEPVGALTVLSSGVKEEAEDSPMAMLRMLSGGGRAGPPPFLVPAKVVGGLVEQAKKQAVEVRAERAKAAAEKPAEAPAPEAAPPDPGATPGEGPGAPK